MVVLIVGEVGGAGEGLAGDAGATGPGGGGVGPTAVLDCEPGRTIVSESCILGLVLGSIRLSSAKFLRNELLGY